MRTNVHIRTRKDAYSRIARCLMGRAPVLEVANPCSNPSSAISCNSEACPNHHTWGCPGVSLSLYSLSLSVDQRSYLGSENPFLIKVSSILVHTHKSLAFSKEPFPGKMCQKIFKRLQLWFSVHCEMGRGLLRHLNLTGLTYPPHQGRHDLKILGLLHVKEGERTQQESKSCLQDRR